MDQRGSLLAVGRQSKFGGHRADPRRCRRWESSLPEKSKFLAASGN